MGQLEAKFKVKACERHKSWCGKTLTSSLICCKLQPAAASVICLPQIKYSNANKLRPSTNPAIHTVT